MKKKLIFLYLLIAATLSIPYGCKKETDASKSALESQPATTEILERGTPAGQLNTEIAQKWMKMQLQIMRTTSGISNLAFVRPYAYSGIAFYESVKPGMPRYLSLSGQLNAMPPMPAVDVSLRYHWPSSANACMASFLKKMYPTTSAANVASVDSLESAMNTQYSLIENATTLARSITFGRDVALLIFNWSETDGYLLANAPYVVPVGPGKWVPTPPAFAPAPLGPYWGNLRVMVTGSGDNAQPPPPPAYSTTPGSPFYEMVKNVYDVSLALTQAQKDQAIYWKDIPGLSSPGHFLNILEQVLENDNTQHLDKAAAGYALTCINVYDASISTWQTKYANNLIRPVSYIQTVLGHPTWLPYLGTPNHPEYTSAHASLSAANANALSRLFGKNHPFTDHSYDYLGFPSRSYSSFYAIAQDAANSRVFAGIHYQASCDLGLAQGYKVSCNIDKNLHLTGTP